MNLYYLEYTYASELLFEAQASVSLVNTIKS